MLPTRTSPDRRVPVVERLAGWSARHRPAAIAGWLAFTALAVVLGALAPGTGLPSHDPGESGVAQDVLRRQTSYAPYWEQILVQGDATADLVTTLRASGLDVRTPQDDPRRLTADGRSTLVSVRLPDPRQADAEQKRIEEAVHAVAARHPASRPAEAGDLSINHAVDDAIKGDLGRSGLTSLPFTLVVLVLVFGALIAAAVPLLLAASTLAATFGLLSIVDKVVPVNSATSAMTLLIGMAVGVDYSLFFLRRYREERASGHDVGRAIAVTAGTSGRVVVVAGLTVVLCLAGLLFTGIDSFRGLTVSAVLVVGIAAAGAVTVLPATLAALGPWLDRPRIPFLKQRKLAKPSRFWGGVADSVTRRPVLWGGLAVVVLALLTAPALGLRLQTPSPTESLPRSVPAIDAATRIQEAFPGVAMPAEVVLWRENGAAADSPDVRRAIDALAASVTGPVTTDSVDRALVIRVPLPGKGFDNTATQALTRLRTDLLPHTIGQMAGVGFAVEGRLAEAVDFGAQVRKTAPYVYGFVLLLAFALILLAFRSLAVPIVSLVLNLLSLGAAYGVSALVFQDGFLAPLLGFTPYGGILDWQPLFLFVLLFGLSTDYHIFILSRIRERRLAGASPRDAIVGGTAASSGVVTCAAVIMTGVFSVFVTLSAVEYKMLGLGMAVAVLIDATVVRGVLLPASLALVWRRRSAA